MPENRVFIRGEVDIATAPRLRANLVRAIGAGDGDLVVDCYDMTFIDAAGIGVLIAAHHNLQNRGRELRIEQLARPVRRVFEILELIATFRVGASLEHSH